jgi:hypothetical protein
MPEELLPHPDSLLSHTDDQLAFDCFVAPSAQAHRTRQSYYGNWKTFVTYTFVHGELGNTLPTTRSILKGYL